MYKTLLYITFIFAILIVFVNNAHATKSLNDATTALNTVSQKTGIDQSDLTDVVGNTVNMFFIFVGLIFFGLMVYAGLRWMTARDQADKVEKARNTMIGAVIGLAILLAAYAITVFVQTKIIIGG
ncbi:MAG: hypothetical protein WC025_01475 [Candidatus Magasanikbacteria bacterium]